MLRPIKEDKLKHSASQHTLAKTPCDGFSAALICSRQTALNVRTSPRLNKRCSLFSSTTADPSYFYAIVANYRTRAEAPFPRPKSSVLMWPYQEARETT
jgi:hypothetical protein